MKNNLWILLACVIFVTVFSSNELNKKNTAKKMSDSTLVKLDSTSVLANEDKKAPWEDFNRYDSLFMRVGKERNVDWLWLKSIMIKESHGQGHFISTTGAVGLMQLMPREGSFTDENYHNYKSSRKQARRKDGLRYFKGESEVYWASAYRNVLDSLQNSFSGEELYKKDRRFDPKWNINDAARQFSSDYHFFKARKHGPYTARILAFAAYNAGRYAVMQNKEDPTLDKIPINRQTELYVANVERIFQELKKAGGKVDGTSQWVLNL